MRKIQGIRNDRGYTELRIWPGPKRNPDGSINTPYRKLFGPYTVQNIMRAKEHMERVRKEFSFGKTPTKEPKPILLSFACDVFFKRHFEQNSKRSRRSKDTARSIIKTFREHWPVTALHTIKPKDVGAYRERFKHLGPNTLNGRLTMLKSLYNRMDAWVKRGEIDPVILPEFNPVRYVESLSTVACKRDRYASREELKRLKEWCQTNDLEMWRAIELAILTGLRTGDLQKSQAGGPVRGIQEKTKRPFILPVVITRPVNFSGFHRRWTACRKAAGMPDFHWHDFRHTNATMLKQLGAADEVIRETLGHANIEQTWDYTNAREERLKPWFDKLQKELEAI